MGISIKTLQRRITVAAGIAVVMIVASVPAFSQYRYDRSRSVNRRGSILGQIFGRRVVRRPIIYSRYNRYPSYNNYYYRGNSNWRGRSYGYNNNYYRSDRHQWRGRGVGHYRSRGRGHRNW